MTLRNVVVLFLAAFFLVTSASAQVSPDLENGFKHWGSYEGSPIDSVNNLNGNTMLHGALLQNYPQRGGLAMQEFIYQTSKTWQVTCQGNASGGIDCFWTTPWNGPVIQQPLSLAVKRTLDKSGSGTGTVIISAFGYSIVGADGATHQLFGIPGTQDSNGEPTQFDSIDGTGYHLVTTDATVTVTDRHGNQYMGTFVTSGDPCSPLQTNHLPPLTTPQGDSIQPMIDDSPMGDQYCPQIAYAQQVIDSNGNRMVFGADRLNSPLIDTLGRTVPLSTGAVTTDYSDCSSAHAISYAYLANYSAPDGSTRQMKVCMAGINIQTAFNVQGVMEIQNAPPGPHTVQFLQVVTIVLADGTKWTFDYDSYGEVTSVGLPTGGSITYTWTTIGFPSCSNLGGDKSRAVASRTLTDNNGHSSTWSYNWGTVANSVISNTVTDPLLNDTVHVFTSLSGTGLGGCSFYETQTRYYQGTGDSRALLKQVDTTYSGASFTVETGSGDALGNVEPTSIKTTVYPSGKVNLVTKTYDAGPGNGRPIFGNLLTEKEYDWGQGAPGSLLREIDYTYKWQVDSNYLTAQLVDLPASVIVKDGSGCTVAKTTYGYDETVNNTGLQVANISTQHFSPPGPVRGNQTSVNKYLWTLGNGSCASVPAQPSAVSHAVWYDTGEVYQTIDPLGHTTTHSYHSDYVGAYSTKTCNALNQCVTGTYDLNSGVLTSLTDANATQQAVGNMPGDAQHTSHFSYDYLFRLTSAQAPPDPSNSSAQAQTTFTFSAPNTFPLSVQRQKSITNTLSDSATAYFDGLGRPYQTQHVMPNGTAKVDTTYDAASQVATVSNPYFATSDPTYGLVQPQYDALGRITQSTKQDGSILLVDYSAGNCITATDEAGKSRRSCSDALGRLTEVDEPQASATGTSGTATVAISGTLQHAPAMLSSSGSRIASYAVTDGDHVYYLGSEQHVHQLYYNNQYWMDQDLTSATSGPLAAIGSSVAGYSASDGQHIYYVASNQHVHHLIYANGWVDQDLTAFTSAPLASSSGGLAAYSISDGQHIYYVGANQHIYQLNYAGSWIYQDLMGFTGAPLAASGTALSAYAISDGQHIYYEGSNQHIYQLYYGGSWIYQDLTAFTNAPLAASGSSGLASYAISDGQHIYYIGSNQHVYQLYYGSSWMLQDLTLFTSAPLAVSGSGLASYAASDGQHIDYVGSDQNIYQLYWNNQAWLFQNVTSIASAPAASSSSGLTALALSDGQHIFYVAGDEHLNQLYWNNQNWLDQDLSVMASFSVNDSGLVSLSVGSFTATSCFGPSTNTACTGQPVNRTTGDVATALAQVLNGANSPVTATVAGSTLNLIWKASGPFTPAVSALSTGHDNPTLFPNASFTSPASSFSGGAGTSLANGYTTLYSYDALGNLLTVTQKGDTTDQTKWRVRTFTYDSLGRLLAANNPESGQISYVYDNDGNLLQKTSPQANQSGSLTTTVSYCYDVLHRVTAKGYISQSCPLTSPVVSYVYDQGTNGIGHLNSLTDQAGSASYSYDVLGRLSGEQRTINAVTKSVAYSYNLDGSLKTLTYPSGAAITYTPDSAGRMLSAIDGGNNINYVTGAIYGPDSALTGFISGHSTSFNGITNTFSFNKRLQPVNMSATSPSQTVFSIGYDFHLGAGDNGNVWGITNYRETSRNQSFTYDALNRLTSAQNAGTDCSRTTVNGKTEYWGNNYSYDAWGNLLQKTVTKCSAENLSLTADIHNWVHTNATPDYAYDAVGNMTHDATSALNYTFDQENRITGAAGYTYTYDGDGNRVEKSTTSTPATGTIYWYMTPGIVAESDLAGALKSEYVFFDGERAARRDLPGGAVFYYFSDHLKTASVVTDSTGTIKSESDYYPWGGELQFVTNDNNHYKFTGKERDAESGLDYFGARYYSNGLGRFITPDWSAVPVPVPYADFTDPQSLNQYTFVRNIPTTKVDADGHDWPSWSDVVNFAVGAANSYGSDNLLGAGRMEQTTTAGKIGQAFGDAAATVSGVVETLGGIGGEVGGVALDATGIGAIAGVPLNIASAGVIAHGGTTTTVGFSHLLKDASDSGGAPNPNGSKGAPDHQEKVGELVDKAKGEAKAGEKVESNKQVKGIDSTRRPDAQIVNTKGQTRKVFEAERRPNSARNKKREAEYKKLKLPNETHPLK